MARVIKAIPVFAYTTPDGFPTCSSDAARGHTCRFFTVQNSGALETCGVTGDRLRRADDGIGFTQPVKHCPIWGTQSLEI
jgi:hypothetical protein